MFKAGDVATILATGKTTAIVKTLPTKERKFPSKARVKAFPVETADGIFDEVELHQAHPSVLFTTKLADPEYLAWLKPVGRAEAWVSRFNLGPDMIVRTPKEISDQQNVKDFLEGKEEV